MTQGHCFAYGSLMCPDILARVIGRAVPGEAARLDGYRRLAVAGEEYPGLVEAAGHSVTGVLYRDLDAAAWRRLDEFEGEEYERVRVDLLLAGRDASSAWVYLFRPEYRHRLIDRDWDFEAFRREGKARFSTRYVGFDRTTGTGRETQA